MLIPLVTALVTLTLLGYLGAGALLSVVRHRPRRAHRKTTRQRVDPGTERRAERKARELLRSIVNEEEWAMYRDLGFLRMRGRMAGPGAEPYSYLLYPHRPIVAYLERSGSLLSEYCVEFPDRTLGDRGPRLPDSDDVLAKWMMIKADEERLIKKANMHLPGRQVDPDQVRRDLRRLADWERAAGEHTTHVMSGRGQPAGLRK